MLSTLSAHAVRKGGCICVCSHPDNITHFFPSLDKRSHSRFLDQEQSLLSKSRYRAIDGQIKISPTFPFYLFKKKSFNDILSLDMLVFHHLIGRIIMVKVSFQKRFHQIINRYKPIFMQCSHKM